MNGSEFSWSEFFHMGGYAVYVWSSYGLALLLVVANIVHDVLIELAQDLEKVTSPGGVLILSGLIYGDQTRSIGDCFQSLGFRLFQEKQEGEWGALALKKQPRVLPQQV